MKHRSQPRNYQLSVTRSIVPVFLFWAFVLLYPAGLQARPVSSEQAKKAVRGWLKLDPEPLKTQLGNQVRRTDVFSDDKGEPIYYVIYLQPSGFVITPADDLVEPIIAFANDGTFDPSADNPLGALVSRDVPGRIAVARNLRAAAGASQKSLTGRQMAIEKTCLRAQGKWAELNDDSNKVEVQGLPSISDVRVAPLTQSEWGQTWVCYSSWYCYNYYTPSHYPCGCVATAMAQVMRYHEHPGTYVWSNMLLKPEDNCGTITESQRMVIGELCYDVAESVDTTYGSEGSSAYLWKVKDALPDIFGYSNAIDGWDYNNDLSGPNLNGMVNPNLDAGFPVLLGVRRTEGGHAIVADGYGYDSSTLYHHINMGWDGMDDAWYNLPTIDAYYEYTTVDECIYNIYTSGTGEIISGRVTDTSGNPIDGATVTGTRTGGGVYSDTTDSSGIYALAKVPSLSTYTVSVTKTGYTLTSQVVTTGKSTDEHSTSGNKWEIDFIGTATLEGCDTITIGTGTGTWDYPMHTYYHDSRTQVIYLSSEIGSSGNITKLALYIETVPGQTMDNWTIRMKHTSMNSYDTASLDATDWIVVYQASETITTTGWNTFTFSTPFKYNGSDNLLVDFSHNDGSYTTSGYCTYSIPGGMRAAYAQSDSGHGDPLYWSGTSSPTVYGANNVPNIQLTFCAVGDFDSNGIVELYDLGILASAWLSSSSDENWNPACDIHEPADNLINFLDYAVFAQNWLASL
ncbi:MAG: C10 family peptidase [Phycisphaerae bacterium]|nr:C10 family peptidase [Phycisphaerae bacterium]